MRREPICAALALFLMIATPGAARAQAPVESGARAAERAEQALDLDDDGQISRRERFAHALRTRRTEARGNLDAEARRENGRVGARDHGARRAEARAEAQKGQPRRERVGRNDGARRRAAAQRGGAGQRIEARRQGARRGAEAQRGERLQRRDARQDLRRGRVELRGKRTQLWLDRNDLRRGQRTLQNDRRPVQRGRR